MEQIIKVNVYVDNDKMVTDSRNIADVFNKRHDNVLRDIENLKKDVLNFEEMFFKDEKPDVYGRNQKIYYMNRDGFTLLAMGFTGKDAVQWKLKYIEAFNALEKAWNTPEQVMARALKIADKQISDLKAVNQVLLEDNQRMKPKEIFADAVSASDTSILVRELAKLIAQNGVDMGEKKLYKWLEDNGYVIKQKGKDYHKPTQKSMNLKVFEIKERVFVGGNGDSFTKTTPMVTAKGQQYFVNKFLAKV